MHFVTTDLDGGPIIGQSRVPVLPEDDADTLAARVLVKEHTLLPATIRQFAEGRLSVRRGKVWLDDRPAVDAAEL